MSATTDERTLDEQSEPSRVLPTLFQQYIHMTHYSRWRDDLGRREHWCETIQRYVDWATKRCMDQNGYVLTKDEQAMIFDHIAKTDVMPSMRVFMTAGKAVEKDNAAAYNCCAIAIDDPRAFDESMYLLMCGCGVGFSVERQFIAKLPEVPDRLFPCDDIIVVDDNRRSWAASYRRLLAMLWAGHIPKWDVSRLRPAGSRLKTFGGRASGPAPLVDLFHYTVDVFKGAANRRLTSIECHGIMCKIGDIVVSGGVRRSALISLSNPSDDRMRDAKSGDWRSVNPHFQLANNSAVWTEKPDPGRFMREWLALYESKSGERGIVNREALTRACKAVGRRTVGDDGQPIPFLGNPCMEIILRSCQMCNLTEVVARPEDSLDDLRRKARVATIMGTIQSTTTDFDYLRPIWRKNCEEERLLGVSITGELDHPVLRDWDSVEAGNWKSYIRLDVEEVNREWAGKLDINPSAMRTCQKPSGTVNNLVNAAPGGHARMIRQGVRRTRVHQLDPISDVIFAAGVPHEQDNYKSENWVLSWPIQAPVGALVVDDMSAIDQLERWLHTKTYYTEHNPSCTIQVGEDEWLVVGAWVYEHFDEIAGLSFLPRDGGHGYTQMPYEELDESSYEELVRVMPEKIDWNLLSKIEIDDQTKNARELACSAGGESCDIA